MSKDDLTKFQSQLLWNLINTDDSLRFGHSEPVLDLVNKGYIEKKEGLFVATKKAVKLKI